MNFKGVQILWKKSGKFTKNLSQLVIHNSEFSWTHLYATSWSSKVSAKVNWFENKKEFEFEIQPTQHL
jgi:hypothetical protein